MSSLIPPISYTIPSIPWRHAIPGIAGIEALYRLASLVPSMPGRRGIPGLPGEDASRSYIDIPGVLSRAFPKPPPGGFAGQQYRGPMLAAATAAPAIAPTGPAVPPVPPASARPIVTPSPPPSPTEPTFEEIAESDRLARAAASYRAPIRAVRLPSGRVIFTNLESWEKTAPERGEGGAREIPYSSALGAERREAIRLAALDETPTGEALSGIMHAQVRAALREEARRTEAEEAGRPFEGPAGAFSMIEGTPEIQQRIALERTLGDLALATSRQELERAMLPPAAAAALANPEVVRTMWLLRFLGPQIQNIRQAAQQRIDEIERTVADPKERADLTTDVQTERDDTIDALKMLMGGR